MAENNTRAGQPGEDNRKRNQVTPETSVQGGQSNDPRSNRDDQGRGAKDNAAGILDTEDCRNGGKASAALQDDDRDGNRAETEDSNEESERTGPGVKKGSAASMGSGTGSSPGCSASGKR